MINPKYLKQFQTAYDSFISASNKLEQNEQDITKIQKYFEDSWNNRDDAEMIKEVSRYKDEANDYFTKFKSLKGLDSLVNRCHEVSQNFVESMCQIGEIFEVTSTPIFITIGNVKLDGKYLYEADINNLEEKIRSGTKYTTPIDFHVWITLPDLSIMDIALHANILDHYGEKDIRLCKIITWREDRASEFEYEPLFIHTDIMSLVD